MPLNSAVDYSRYAFKSSWDNELLGKALLYKQEKYDKNREEIQGFYNNLSGIDLAKEEDRQYFQERMKKLKNEVQLAGMGDLSRPGVKEHIESFIGQAADDKVLNGYIGTTSGAKIKQQAYQTQQKNPEKYSDLNLGYSLRDYNAWLNDGQVGSAYRGGTSYIPYTDVVAKAREVIKEIEPNAYVELNKYGDFTFYKENGEILTDARIRTALEATIMQDPNVAQQMGINAWGEFGQIDDNTFVNGIRSSYKQQVGNYNKIINGLKNQKLTAKGDELIRINNEIQLQEKNKSVYGDLMNLSNQELLKRRDSISTQMYKDNFLSQMGDAYEFEKIKDKGFETYQEGLVKWQNEQDIYKIKLKADLDKKAEGDKIAGEIVKMNLSEGREGAMLFGVSQGWTREQVAGILDNTVVSPIEAPNENKSSTLFSKSMKHDIGNAAMDLDRQENNVLSLIDKKHFGYEDGFPQDSQGKYATEQYFEYLASSPLAWESLITAGKVRGNHVDMKEAWNQYKKSKDEYNTLSELRSGAEAKVTDYKLGKMVNGEAQVIETGAGRPNIEVQYQNGNYTVYERRVSPSVMAGKNVQRVPVGNYTAQGLKNYLTSQNFKAADGQPLYTTVGEMLPNIDAEIVYAEEFGSIYGDAINGAAININDRTSAGAARELLNKVGYQNFTNEFKAKIGKGLQEGVIEGMITNTPKNKEGDEKVYQTFNGLQFGVNLDGTYYAKIDDVEQKLDPRLLSQTFLGRKLLASGNTINLERKEAALQNYKLRGTKVGDVVRDEFNAVTLPTYEFNDGSKETYHSKIVYEINNIPDTDNQVKTLLEVYDSKSNIITSKYLDSQYKSLYEAKEAVRLNDLNSGFFKEYGYNMNLKQATQLVLIPELNKIEDTKK